MTRTSIHSIYRTDSQIQMLRNSAPVRIAVKIDYYLLTGKWPKGPSIFVFARLCWERLMSFAPTREQSEFVHDTAWLLLKIADFCLKAAVILGVLYLAIEVGSAFLPGGPVSRVLGGLQ